MGEDRGREAPGSARLVLAGGVVPLHPDLQTFEAMLEGWRAQQLARGLAASTIGDRLRLVRRFAEFTNDWPWNWTPGDLEEWTAELRSRPRPVAHSTIRMYQQSLALFLAYTVDARYGWAAVCEERFGTHPVQICHEWNSMAHVTDYEGQPNNRRFPERSCRPSSTLPTSRAPGPWRVVEVFFQGRVLVTTWVGRVPTLPR